MHSCNLLLQASWWGCLQGDVSREEVASLVEELLRDKAAMLQEYFGIRVDPDGCLCALPQLIEGYVPDLDYLPTFVLGLARDVDWSSEQQCFHDVAEVRCAVKVQPPANLSHSSPWSAEAAQCLAVLCRAGCCAARQQINTCHRRTCGNMPITI